MAKIYEIRTNDILRYSGKSWKIYSTADGLISVGEENSAVVPAPLYSVPVLLLVAGIASGAIEFLRPVEALEEPA